MMSKPASVISHPQEAAKIPLKGRGLDIASQMESVKRAEPDLVGAVGDYSASVAQALGMIEAIEAKVQQKREQIEEIQARQELLAREYRQLGETLDTATKDLAEEFFEIIADLEADRPIAVPSAETAFEARETHAEPPAELASETEEIPTEPSRRTGRSPFRRPRQHSRLARPTQSRRAKRRRRLRRP
jgi:chromosome segregation ATPase